MSETTLKPLGKFLVKACQLLDLLDEEEKIWWEEWELEKKKRDLSRKIIAKIEEIQNATV